MNWGLGGLASAALVAAACRSAQPAPIVGRDPLGIAAAVRGDTSCAAATFVGTQRDSAGQLRFAARTSSGQECLLPPRVRPVAYFFDDRLVCPDSTPATWSTPRRLERIGLDEIARIVEDSAKLSRLRCPMRPVAAVYLNVASLPWWARGLER